MSMSCEKCGSETPIGHSCIVDDLEAMRNAPPTPEVEELFRLIADERHWRTLPRVAPTDRDAWRAVDEALRPFVNCEPKNHHPASCPAVQAVMAALTPTRRETETDPTPKEAS